MIILIIYVKCFTYKKIILQIAVKRVDPDTIRQFLMAEQHSGAS